MKKCLYCIGLFTFFVFMSVIFANAQQRSEYLITQSEGEYSLYKTDADTSECIASSSDLESLLKATAGSAVTLNTLEVHSALTLTSGEYFIRGSAVFYDCFCVEGDAKVTLDSFSASFFGTRAYIRIKGGDLTVLNASISSENSSCAVLDYSAKSHFLMYDGTLLSKSTSALCIQNGAAGIYGGSIVSEAEYAIENKATLSLSNRPEISANEQGILTDTPISLSATNNYFSGNVSVKYLSEFNKGSKTEVLRACTAESIKGITLFDKNGNETSLRYFEYDEYSGERKFAAVYRPYILRMFDNGSLIGKREFLHTDELLSVTAPKKDGYIFDRWYFNEALSEPFVPSEAMPSDFDIYAAYSLKAPEFSLSSLDFVYSGNARTLDFDSISHELSDSGRFEFEWFKNGTSLGTFDGGVNIRNVSDSGEYYCKITFYCGNDKVSVTTPKISVSVSKKTVPVPMNETAIYSGKVQYSSLRDNALYTVDDTGGLNAGFYSVTLTLRSPENYEFDSGAASVSVKFEITKAENGWASELVTFDVYQNQAPICTAYARFGEVYYLFSDKRDGEYTAQIPKKTGVYYAIAVVEETENYSGIISEPKEFSVIEEKAIGLTLLSMPTLTEYRAFDIFNPAGLEIEVLYNSGRRESAGAQNLSISYQTACDIRYGDTGVTVSYLGCDVMIPITVTKCKYDVSNILFENKTVVYDGAPHTITYQGELPIGKDGIALTATVSASVSDAGRYTVSMVFNSESKNYELPEAKTAILEITPFICEVRWGACEFVYDGTPKLPSAEFTDVFGKTVMLSPAGSIINATELATATVTPPSPNYVFANPTVCFTVKKATYDFSGVAWEAESYPYNGKEQSNGVVGLPDGVYVIGYTDNKGVDVGKYKTSALLHYDENNYNAPPILTHEWEITAIEYDTDGFSFESVQAVYDGNMHFPRISGELPAGLDGIPLQYKFSEGAAHVADGKKEVIITFFTDSKNYIVPKPISAFVEILPMPIDVIWEYTLSYYNGTAHLPSAKSEFCEIKVSGEGVDAGDYVATAAPAYSDFIVTNPTYNFSVLLAENYFTQEPSIENIFVGDEPNPSGKAFCGEVVFKYYTDESCTEAAQLPLSFGNYYMRAEVRGQDNYTDLFSKPIEFSVLAVSVCGIEVNLILSEPRAFYKLSENDLEIFAVHTNGEKTPILFKDVNISYQNSDSLRASDEHFTVFYGEFSLMVPITVKKAVMEMSAFVWDRFEAVYNGSFLQPKLINLPYGVSVEGYEGGGINAGSYIVSAVLNYDTENYEAPPKVECSFTVNKQTVPTPEIPEKIYNGQEHNPVSDSALYTFSSERFVNAGDYSILAILSDSENYIFENGSESVQVPFRVGKRQINATVSPMVLYRNTEEYMPEFTLGGAALRNDDLMLYYEVSDGIVYIKSANPNYEIVSVGAEVIIYDSYSPEATENIIILSILILLLIFVALVLFFSKDKILHKIAAAKCKRKFSSEKKPSPPEITGIDVEPIAEASEEAREDLPEMEELSEKTVMSVDMERADSLITDSLAKNLLRSEGEAVYTSGRKKYIVNVDTLSENFSEGERVDVNSLKEHNLVAKDTGYVKILARGTIDKPLSVYANAFSLSAVKMIALTGGVAVKVTTIHKTAEKEDSFDKDY